MSAEEDADGIGALGETNRSGSREKDSRTYSRPFTFTGEEIDDE